MRRYKILAAFLSMLFYAVMMLGLFLDPKCVEVSRKAFGERLLGLPWYVFQFGLLTFIYLPIPCFLWHAVLLYHYASQEGESAGGMLLLVRYMLFRMGRANEEAQHSRRVVLLGLFYVMSLAIAWIVFTESKGI